MPYLCGFGVSQTPNGNESWKGDILYGCNISGTVLSVGVCIYSASQPALVSGIAYGFSECVGVQGDWTCIFICSV